MKGTLIKTDKQEYRLYTNDSLPFATTDNSPYKKLSLKNCESIENGYDLDELAVLSTKEETTIVGNQKMAQGFIKGFQKALSILGDKKFSEEDMFSFAEYCLDNSDCFSVPSEGLFKKWKSLQQNEWDVEVEMEEVAIGDKYTPDPKPKLDEDRCLILKRI